MLGGRVWVCFNWWVCSADSLPRSCSVLLSPQWWDRFQKHDNSLWVGETANASADRRLASWHSSFCDLWRPILHRWQLWYQHPVPATEVLCEDNSEYGAMFPFTVKCDSLTPCLPCLGSTHSPFRDRMSHGLGWLWAMHTFMSHSESPFWGPSQALWRHWMTGS